MLKVSTLGISATRNCGYKNAVYFELRVAKLYFRHLLPDALVSNQALKH